MLVPIQTRGTKPPFFFVHGLFGVMPIGRALARALGPEQPLYALHADGLDGRQAPNRSLGSMAAAYLAEIVDACPHGRITVGGMCGGTLTAIEIARALLAKGRTVSPVILADPPPVPFGTVWQNFRIDLNKVGRQLYESTKKKLVDYAARPDMDIPFDGHDPQQLHVATLAAMATAVAFWQSVPVPFTGAAAVILSVRRAPYFFQTDMPWHKLLPNPPVVHVVARPHNEMFRAGRQEVARLIGFNLDKAFPAETPADQQLEASLA